MEKPTLYDCLMKGEVNVVLASDAISATNSAADLVKAFNAEERRVYSVNTVYNMRVLNAMLRKRLGPDYPIDDRRNKLFYFSSEQHGELGRSQSLRCEVGWDNYDVVIVTTWEMAARSYRYRAELIYDLVDLSSHGVTVVIYSTATTEPKSGRADRGGIGRLAIVASNILSIEKMYRSNIGLTTEEIREAARQAWPKEYEEYAREQDRKQKAKESLVSSECNAFNELDASRSVGQPDGRSVKSALPIPQPLASRPSPECAQLTGKEINILPAPRHEKMSKSHPLYWLAMANNPDAGEEYHPYSVAAQFRYMVEDPSMNDPLPYGWEELYRDDKWFRKLVDESVGFEALKAASEKAREFREFGELDAEASSELPGGRSGAACPA